MSPNEGVPENLYDGSVVITILIIVVFCLLLCCFLNFSIHVISFGDNKTNIIRLVLFKEAYWVTDTCYISYFGAYLFTYL